MKIQFCDLSNEHKSPISNNPVDDENHNPIKTRSKDISVLENRKCLSGGTFKY